MSKQNRCLLSGKICLFFFFCLGVGADYRVLDGFWLIAMQLFWWNLAASFWRETTKPRLHLGKAAEEFCEHVQMQTVRLPLCDCQMVSVRWVDMVIKVPLPTTPGFCTESPNGPNIFLHVSTPFQHQSWLSSLKRLGISKKKVDLQTTPC